MAFRGMVPSLRAAASLLRPSRRPLSSVVAAAREPAPFPSLLISSNGVSASGSFAEAQATFLNPDKDMTRELDLMLKERRVGLVAHYYMDAELQGTLASLTWPHVFIADSLAMGEAAVKMAGSGEVDTILCMGVDFMAESVRATLDSNNFQKIPVFRLSDRKIGCSLAESAERAAYAAWLKQASSVPNSLHVVYINTSLVTKAQAHEVVPTITCTSSNVLQTILQAYHQIPDLTIWYGPDTYMGENLYSMLQRVAKLPDEQVAALHPGHTAASVRSLLDRFHYFKQGNCVVHHMFGDEVVSRVRRDYGDAYHTAHLEVPGEMFALAMDAQEKGRGVVGSTSNILDFIVKKTAAAVKEGGGEKRLKFVLGTEAGMVTSIVRGVEKVLKGGGASSEGVAVEIVFPVASEAVSATGSQDDLAVVPGVRGGEGCSTAGGCATCPFMKMNSLDALVDVLARTEKGGLVTSKLQPFLPPRRDVRLMSGRPVAEVGSLPIRYMRSLMQQKQLPEELVTDIVTRHASRSGSGGASETAEPQVAASKAA